MNKTRNGGFTLVELLAVIVILAVVILIAVTAVVPRMNNAKKKAFIDEALVYLKAGKEMLVSDNAHGCYLITDLGNYVKQNKDGYSGTIFVSDSRVSLNLTNGKYYLKTDNNRNISETDLVESAPNDFLSTCTAPTNPTNYSITYELNGGNVSGTNPSSYNSYSDDIHLINPTKSGYRFVGWSGGKNLFDEDNVIQLARLTFDNDLYSASDADDKTNLSLKLQQYNENSILETKLTSRITDVGHYSLSTSILSDTTRMRFANAGSHREFSLNFPCLFDTSTNVVYSFDLVDATIGYVKFRNVQFEKGATPTEYEKYVSNNTNVTIPKGSSGNRVYTANWEAI